MAEPTIPSRDELIDELRTSGESAVREVRAVPAASFEQGRYENGWNAKQILAHIASIEWTYPRLIDLAKQESTPAATEAAKQRPEQASEAVPRPNILDYNERQVAKRAEASIEELIAEFERNRAQTVSAFAAVDPLLLAAPIRSAGGISGTLAEVVRAVAIAHIAQHVRDIKGAT
jgi:uncharacterized damage-inducible protein DinB